MALDPSISLGIRPPVIPLPEIQSPLDRFAKVLSLRNLMTQGESQQLQLQQQQQQFQDEQTLRANPNMTDAELIGAMGSRAVPLLKARSELYEQQLKTNAQKAARLGQLAGSAVDAPSYNNAIMTAVSEKLIDPEHARQLSALDWNDPATQAQVKQFQTQALTAEQQHNALIADEKARREKQLFGPQLAKAESDADQSVLQTAGQNAQLLSDASQIPAFIAQLPAGLQKRFKNLSSLPLDEFKRYAGMGAGAPKVGETIPLPADVQKQKVEQQAALGLATEQAKQGFVNAQNEALINAVMNDKTGVVYANLPGGKQSEIAPLLAQRGWTQFAAKPSDTELTKLQDTQKAIDIAGSLRSTLKAQTDLIGPASGQLTKLPWGLGMVDVEGRKKLQAQIDLARQIIGKGLEGGVLRKEDEEKYKNILPTMTDLPAVADSKLEQLQGMLTRDLGTYRQSLTGAGRQLPGPATPAGGSAGIPQPTDGGRIVDTGQRVTIGGKDSPDLRIVPAGQALMKSPTGQLKLVPQSQVEHYKSKGAVEIQ